MEGARAVSEVRLTADEIEAIARRVAELVRPKPTIGLADADEVAEILGMSRSWVYRHANELGAIRVGTGRRARLRFDRERVRVIAEQFNADATGSTQGPAPSATIDAPPPGVELLPARRRVA